MDNNITWKKEFSLVTNRFVLKDLFRVILITTIIFQIFVSSIVYFANGDFFSLKVCLTMDLVIILGFGILALFSMLLLGNRYNAEFTVNQNGISYKSGLREERINRFVLFLMLITKPKSSGSAFLAVDSEANKYDWKEIKKIIQHKNQNVIEVKNSWRTVVRLYCTPENYEEVLSMCNRYIAMG